MAENFENVIYHHDNAPPNTSSSIRLELEVLEFQLLDHPPYNPDLTPMDFPHFHPYSKNGGKDQESIQSSTTPDPGYHMGKLQKHN